MSDLKNINSSDLDNHFQWNIQYLFQLIFHVKRSNTNIASFGPPKLPYCSPTVKVILKKKFHLFYIWPSNEFESSTSTMCTVCTSTFFNNIFEAKRKFRTSSMKQTSKSEFHCSFSQAKASL